MSIKPTLKEIADITDVSIATVSRALREPDKVKYSTRKKIEKALAELSSEVAKPAKKLLGLIVPDLSNQFFCSMLSGVEEAADGIGYSVFLCSSDNKEEKESLLLQQLLDAEVDGIIIITAGKTTSFLKQLMEGISTPIVFLDRIPDLKNINCVTTNNYEGMFQAANYILTLGHKRILYLGGVAGTSTDEQRKRGFIAACEDAGQHLSPDNFLQANYDQTTAYQKITELISSKSFNFTAICAANDTMALGSLEALAANKIAVPQEVSVIGYDDIPAASFAKLTTVKQPFYDMGRNAAYLLMSLILDPLTPNKTMVLPSSIVFRKTCAIVSQRY